MGIKFVNNTGFSKFSITAEQEIFFGIGPVPVQGFSSFSLIAREAFVRPIIWLGQTLKLSPQPQRSRSLGLTNSNPSLRPLRTKSMVIPSR